MSNFIAKSVVLAGLMLAGGCAALTPEDPDLINDRLRLGPGLLSGAAGEFVLFRETRNTGQPKAD